jgi:hypothetical protein
VTVSSSVNLHDECWEEYDKTQVMHPNEPTAILAVVGAEGVQWVAKRGNVEAVLNMDLFDVDSNDSRTRVGGPQEKMSFFK